MEIGDEAWLIDENRPIKLEVTGVMRQKTEDEEHTILVQLSDDRVVSESEISATMGELIARFSQMCREVK